MKRRGFFRSAALAPVAIAGGAGLAKAQSPMSAADPAFKVKNGRIKQSIMGWTFKEHFDGPTLARHCKEIGLVAMEGLDRKDYPVVKELGMEISLVGSHGFAQGPCNPANRDFCIGKLREAIDVAAGVGCKKVITFTGMRFEGMDEAKAAQNCIDVWKEVLPQAEQKGIILCLEHLNSRDNTHPMKGHPGYFGDNVDFCVELINRIASPNLKLLFDIYHVSIMNGDVIRRIRQYKDVIGHYHTAGNPGRAELDDRQEINYPPIMKEILATGYEGYVAQEFIPTWPDPLLALRHAAMTCDV